MVKFKPVIKWTGSKRHQVIDILKHTPKEINTYYEPFIGGGSVLFSVINSDINVNKYVCSDINSDLITLWNTIKNEPQFLFDEYTRMWNEINSIESDEDRKEYFYKVRNKFNETRRPELFLFLSRTCTNGLIRYNSSGNFNTSYHFNRTGIKPDTYKKILFEWSNKLIENNVQFINQSYEEVLSEDGDFLYLDPPYFKTKGVYYGEIEYETFFDWMRKQEGKYLLSFNGKIGKEDNTYEIPKDLFSEHLYLHSGRSSFKDLRTGNTEQVYESLYVK